MTEHCETTDKQNANSNVSHYEQATHNMFVPYRTHTLKKYSTSKKELFTVLYNSNIGFEFTLLDKKGKKKGT